MATLDDLPIPDFLNLTDEAKLQLILEVRHRRAVVIETTRKRDGSVTSTRKRRSVAIPTAESVAQMTEKQITDLYYALMARQQTELL